MGLAGDRVDERLWRVACALNATARLKKTLPPLFFVTDPARTPDPCEIAVRLPQGAGVIYRSFGAADAFATAAALRRVCAEAGLRLLIGQDADLAQACGADGVHLPERDLARAPGLRLARPDWLFTGAAHSAEALSTAADAGLDAALVSPVFESSSRSAGAPLGVDALARLVQGARLPVYALGGVTGETAARLVGSGAAGIAAVDGVVASFS